LSNFGHFTWPDPIHRAKIGVYRGRAVCGNHFCHCTEYAECSDLTAAAAQKLLPQLPGRRIVNLLHGAGCIGVRAKFADEFFKSYRTALLFQNLINRYPTGPTSSGAKVPSSNSLPASVIVDTAFFRPDRNRF
jgi:hypothetical protein